MSGFVVVAALLPVVLFAVWWFSDDAQTRRALKSVRVREIREIQEGMIVRVTGRLRPVGDLLAAPLTGRHCAYSQVIVEERRSNGKSSSWHEVFREVEAIDFQVEDGTGVVHVRMDESRVAITRDAHTASGTFDDATDAEKALLARHGQESTGLIGFNRALRYAEGALEVGEEVTVLGQVSVRTGVDGERVWVLGPTPDRPVFVSDDRGTVAAR